MSASGSARRQSGGPLSVHSQASGVSNVSADQAVVKQPSQESKPKVLPGLLFKALKKLQNSIKGVAEVLEGYGPPYKDDYGM